ncbi:MAG: hypothetical protein DWQ04_27175 [Chloroflexi bacterium]|nr:MAG: hypothetical protein DWQ04_27175 [Chloroflexota bacterium]
MRAARQRVQGKLLEENGRFALRLTNPKPDRDADNLLYVGYALVTLGREDHIFPSFVLDDWGNEIKGVKLFRWIRENGNEFPRAEIFGYEKDGSETQLFARALELYVTLPCYVYDSRTAPVTDGHLLKAILLPDDAVTVPQRIKRPSSEVMKRPLRSARVQWWLVPPETAAFDFGLLKEN